MRADKSAQSFSGQCQLFHLFNIVPAGALISVQVNGAAPEPDFYGAGPGLKRFHPRISGYVFIPLHTMLFKGSVKRKG